MSVSQSTLNLSFLESKVPTVVGASPRKERIGFSIYPAHAEALRVIGGGNASAGLALVVSDYLERAKAQAEAAGSAKPSKASRSR